jgi:hypothetical protein
MRALRASAGTDRAGVSDASITALQRLFGPDLTPRAPIPEAPRHMSCTEVAEVLHCSRSLVQAIEVAALRKLRDQLVARGLTLADFCD